MEKVTQIFRYLSPPIFFLSFIILASPSEIIKQFHDFDGTVNSLTLILSITGLLTSVGFVISGFTYALVTLCGLRARGAPIFETLSYRKYFRSYKKWPEGELEIWALQGEIKNVEKHIESRWSMSMANFNAVTGLLLALTVIIFAHIKIIFPYWWYIFLPTLIIFLFNGVVGIRSVTKINKLLPILVSDQE